MTIRTVTFEDFGVYAGLHRIELAPDRPRPRARVDMHAVHLHKEQPRWP